MSGSGWPPWRRTAEGSLWFEEHPIWLPVCYQLALGPKSVEDDERDLQVMFVGAAPHEDEVFKGLESERLPYSPAIREALRAGRVLWYRAQCRPTLAEAQAFRDELLAQTPYAWSAAGA